MPITHTSSTNNTITTPLWLVKMCLDAMDIQSDDYVLDCCSGINKIWYDNINSDHKSWCEILLGVDFLDHNNAEDYIVGNLPFNIFKQFFDKIIELNPRKGIGIICLEQSITPTRLLRLNSKGFSLQRLIKLKVKEWKFGFNVSFFYFNKIPNNVVSVAVSPDQSF